MTKMSEQEISSVDKLCYCAPMRRMYAPNRIKELRKARGLTQENIAEGVGSTTTKGTIAKLENSAMALSLDYILSIADFLGVRPSEIIEPIGDGARSIPLLELEEVTKWRERLKEPGITEPIPPRLEGDNLFAIRLSRGVMDQVAPDGSVIVVNPDAFELMDGCTYLIGSAEPIPSIKRFNLKPPQLLSLSNGPDNGTIDIGRQPFVTIGRVVHVCFNL